MDIKHLLQEQEYMIYKVAQAINTQDGEKLEHFIYSAVKCQLLGFDSSFYYSGLVYAEKHFPKGWEWYLKWNEKKLLRFDNLK